MTATAVQDSASTGPATSENEVAIRFVDPVNDPRWDEKLSSLSEPSFFHGSAWCQVLRGAYSFQPCYAVAEEGGRLRGVLPLMEADNWPKGRRGVSLPFTDECSVLGAGPGLQQQLFDASIRQGKRNGWKYLEIRSRNAVSTGARVALSFYGHRLELQSKENEILARCDPAVQRAIRRALKAGVHVEIARSLDAMRTFYRLHGRTRRKHGAPPQSLKFFETICEHILDRGNGFVAIAKSGHKPVAAAIFFHWGKRAIFKYGASDERLQHLRGNNLVMWEAIRRLGRDGCDELDFGRTSLQNEGLRRFKSGWGSLEFRINYLKYDFKKESFVKDLDQASGWHSRLFKLFPAPLSRWVGALLYPRLA